MDNTDQTIVFDGIEMNPIQVSRIVEEWFDQNFAMGDGEVRLESFILKIQEETDNQFLMYNEKDMEDSLNYHRRMINAIENLQSRDPHTTKFGDTYYYEK
jgi:hypothetical protein